MRSPATPCLANSASKDRLPPWRPRFPPLLPPLTPAELLEVSMIASVAGELDGGALTNQRPFRSPHHSASMPALVGGGLRARPGEVSLAHNGVLFLDEFPEFCGIR